MRIAAPLCFPHHAALQLIVLDTGAKHRPEKRMNVPAVSQNEVCGAMHCVCVVLMPL